jgi:transcriptional regulator with XRE-family HTH domain
VTDTDRHLSDAIEQRRLELGLSVQDLANQTGLTREGLRPLLRGERRKYQDRLKLPVCRVLGWSPDSIDRLLAGGTVITMNGQHDPPERSRDEIKADLDAILQRLAAIEHGLLESAPRYLVDMVERLMEEMEVRDRETERFRRTVEDRLALLEERRASQPDVPQENGNRGG